MKLVDVYTCENSTQALYELLKKRSTAHSISHSVMPGYAEHEAFVNSKPYRYWYLVDLDGKVVGSTYITENNEVGVFVTQELVHLQCDVLKIVLSGHEPLPAVKSKRVAQFSINSNPDNVSLISAITSVGGVHVQNTYLLSKGSD